MSEVSRRRLGGVSEVYLRNVSEINVSERSVSERSVSERGVSEACRYSKLGGSSCDGGGASGASIIISSQRLQLAAKRAAH